MLNTVYLKWFPTSITPFCSGLHLRNRMAISGYPSTQNLASNSLLSFPVSMVYFDYRLKELFTTLGGMTVDPIINKVIPLKHRKSDTCTKPCLTLPQCKVFIKSQDSFSCLLLFSSLFGYSCTSHRYLKKLHLSIRHGLIHIRFYRQSCTS